MQSPLPLVTLDHTLHDLYSLDGGRPSEIVLAYAYSIPRVQAASSLPLSKKYTFQNPRASNISDQDLATELLQSVPQRYGFISGKMSLILFDLDLDTSEAALRRDEARSTRPYHLDIMEVYNQLSADQQPKVEFVQNAANLALPPHFRLAVLNPMDCLGHLPHVVCPDVHYSLLSKRGLMFSGLPTPRSYAIDTLLNPCETHNRSQVDAEIERMILPLRERSLPFVVKVTQASASEGTFLITSELDRLAAIKILHIELRYILKALNTSNEHLFPCSLIVQEYIPGDCMTASIFVTREGRGVFISCCKQLFNKSGMWGGGCISYLEQEQLESTYSVLLAKVAKFLYTQGYHGPVGVDFIDDSNGSPLIVDLNVRVTGTFQLGCLRGNFTRRGLFEATLLSPLSITCSRNSFMMHFEDNFKSGRIIITSWITQMPSKANIAALVLAGKDKDDLERLIKGVKSFKIAQDPANDVRSRTS